MKILVIYCHPTKNSFNGAILEKFLKNLNSSQEVQLLDLYQENFNPVLKFDAEHRRRDLQFDPETAKYREQIAWADHLVFIFPIWWGSMPAMLKGFIDRVFATGFVYHFEGRLPQPHLKGKTAAIITSHDTPQFYVKFFQQDYGKLLEKQVLKLMAGIKTEKFLQISYLRGASEAKRRKFLDKVGKYARSLS